MCVGERDMVMLEHECIEWKLEIERIDMMDQETGDSEFTSPALAWA
jgi:hypothetical protein